MAYIDTGYSLTTPELAASMWLTLADGIGNRDHVIAGTAYAVNGMVKFSSYIQQARYLTTQYGDASPRATIQFPATYVDQKCEFVAQAKNGSQVNTLNDADGNQILRKTEARTQNYTVAKNIRAYQSALHKQGIFEIYSDFDMTNKIFELHPCQQDSDGQYGVYDTISKQFLGNAAGSGAFTGGYD